MQSKLLRFLFLAVTRTILFFKGGELVDKHVGAITEGDLRKKFDALL